MYRLLNEILGLLQILGNFHLALKSIRQGPGGGAPA